MKKLNKKGFTLVELLAVIVILAVIMVITIPTVLGSMGNAKTSAFNSAVATIEEYLEKNYQVCVAGLSGVGVNYDTSVLTKNSDGTCSFTTNAESTLIANAGYSTTDITIASGGVSLTNGKATITATATDGGKFK